MIVRRRLCVIYVQERAKSDQVDGSAGAADMRARQRVWLLDRRESKVACRGNSRSYLVGARLGMMITFPRLYCGTITGISFEKLFLHPDFNFE